MMIPEVSVNDGNICILKLTPGKSNPLIDRIIILPDHYINKDTAKKLKSRANFTDGFCRINVRSSGETNLFD